MFEKDTYNILMKSSYVFNSIGTMWG